MLGSDARFAVRAVVRKNWLTWSVGYTAPVSTREISLARWAHERYL
jgi:hypothetical protein